MINKADRKVIIKFLYIVILFLSFDLLGQVHLNDEFYEKVKNLSIPEEYGEVTETYFPDDISSTEQFMFIMQTVPLNTEVYKNNHSILKLLINSFGVKDVCVEGSVGTLDCGNYLKFKDENVKKEFVEYFFKNGKITGIEYTKIMFDFDLNIFGVEDLELNNKNQLHYKNAFMHEDSSLKTIYDFEQAILKIIKNYDSDTAFIKTKLLEFYNGSMKLNSFLGFLSSGYLAKILKEAKSKFSYLTKLKSIYEQVNFDLLDTDLKNMYKKIIKSSSLDKDKRSLIKNEYKKFKKQKIRTVDFALLLFKEVKDIINLEDYNNLKFYNKYLVTFSDVSSKKLSDEMKELNKFIYDSLHSHSKTSELAVMLKYFEELISIIKLEALPDLRSKFLEKDNKGYIEEVKLMCSKKDKSFNLEEKDYSSLLQSINECYEFYKTVNERSPKLLEKSINYAKSNNVKIIAICVAGGHVLTITDLLKEKNIPFVLISPKVTTSVDKNNFIKLLESINKLKPSNSPN